MHKTVYCVVFYLAAILMANGLVSYFGQEALPFTSFFLIPFDLLARDVLHEEWKDDIFLWTKMTSLIIGGAILSYVTSIATPAVSFASGVSFLLMGMTNAFVYFLMMRAPRMIRMNVSNLFAAIVDSLVFPLLAFGTIVISLSVAQAVSKTAGGFFWTLLFLYCFPKEQHDHDN